MTQTPREVIAKPLELITSAYMRLTPEERADIVLSAIAAAGYVLCDTKTHAVVPREQAEWQPIETAPTMEAVQVIGGEATYPVTASWSGRYDEPWCLDALEDTGREIDPPTHWRALPDLPAAEAEVKGGDDAG